MSTCPACGVGFGEGERFCPSDGSRLEPDDQDTTLSHKDPLVGRIVDGRYRLERKLGEGGMGAVYRAIHVNMEKAFALKILRPALSKDPKAVKRFQREARSASLLDHEHCIRVSDFGQSSDGLLYLAMEYLEGKSLGDELYALGAMSAARIVYIARQICQALAHAHDQSLVHRDLKPDNVFLLTREGKADFVKVLDFGLAKLLEREYPSGASGTLTEAGIVFGTPEYMSPEQADGRPLTPRTDLYSFGITLYHMMTGQLPFMAPTYMRIMTQHLTEPPISPAEKRPDLGLPPALVSIVMSCLEKDPENRPPTARAVIELLDAADLTPAPSRVPREIASHPTVDVSVVMAPVQPPRRRAWLAIPIVAAIALPLGYWALSGSEPKSEPEPDPLPVPATPLPPTADSTPAPAVGPAPATPDAAPTIPSPTPATASADDHLRKAQKARGTAKEVYWLQETLRLDPGNSEAHFRLGEIGLAAGNKDLGCKHLKRALRINQAKTLYEKAECGLVGP